MHLDSLLKPCSISLQKQHHLRKRGFTLLELLVVISIIGILIALGTVAYSTAQKKGRDARRTGDMKALQSAMEQYYAENSSLYPASIGSLSPNYINGIPTDPKNSGVHIYNTSNPSVVSSSGYCLCARLESVSKGNASSAPSSISCNFATGDFFCVTNLQ